MLPGGTLYSQCGYVGILKWAGKALTHSYLGQLSMRTQQALQLHSRVAAKDRGKAMFLSSHTGRALGETDYLLCLVRETAQG